MHNILIKIIRIYIIAAVAVIIFWGPNLFIPGTATAAPTTNVTIKKIAADGTTVLAQQTVDYRWLMTNLPMMGDGVTQYYHQGPVFIDDANEAKEQASRWNPTEDTNIEDKDMGAVQGTNIKDLCNLVGGMAPGDTLKIKARDGLVKTFAYRNVYQYSHREGPMVLCWCRDGSYPDSGYSEGMRLVWLADTSTNPWGWHVFGNWDWHSASEERYWYYYMSGSEKYPTTTGLSVQNVAELTILCGQTEPAGPKIPAAGFGADVTSGSAPLTVQFSDQSLNSPISSAWDFENDGNIDSQEHNPAFTFSQAGNYSVKLTVQNGSGKDEIIKANYISVGSIPANVSEPASPPATGSPDGAVPAEPQAGRPAKMLLAMIGMAAMGLIISNIVARKR